MRQEYNYLMQFAGWIFLWTFLPFVAFPLMIYVVCRHFLAIRHNRKHAEHIQVLHVPDRDQRWMEMEGFTKE
jgi:hypothetical protein